jgi:cold shock protein
MIDDSVLESKDEVIEIAGAIKWFDAAKGYGFIVPDDESMGDVLLHVTILRREGLQTAFGGARVVCQALRQPKGLQAFRILEMDESTAVKPFDLKRVQIKLDPNGDFELVKCKWFNRVRGFGFLTRGEGTGDIFIHMITLRECGFIELKPEQEVMALYGTGPKGLVAVEIKSVRHKT